jgi:hypothetical protein
MRILPIVLVMSVFAVVPTDGNAQGTRTVWSHNGSQLHLSANGQRREFRYQTPKAELLEAGVQPGTLLFQGSRVGNAYAGTAYVFPQPCGALPYSVSGSISTDERTITLYGSAPSAIYTDCEVAAHRDDVLVFELAETEPQIGEAEDYGEEGRLFSSGSDEYFLVNKTPDAREAATGYVGRVRVVHHYPGGGYEILMKDYVMRCATADNTLSVAWSNSGDENPSVRVAIRDPARAPKSQMKESYNLYWAVCRKQFRKFR